MVDLDPSNSCASVPHNGVRAIRIEICQGRAVADDGKFEREVTRTRRIGGRKLLLWLLVVLVVAVVPSVVVPTLMCRPEKRDLPVIGHVEPFSLVDELGRPFTDEAMRGKVSIVSFIFTRCDTICPVTAMKVEKIQEKTFNVGRDVKLVSFSVDPKYDTPEKLAAFGKLYRADPERWRFVTGPYDAVYKVVEGSFMTSMMQLPDRPSGAPDIAHGGYFLLVDRALNIRGTYDSGQVHNLDQLMSDARYLARTQR
jgi:protein SCO1/2